MDAFRDCVVVGGREDGVGAPMSSSSSSSDTISAFGAPNEILRSSDLIDGRDGLVLLLVVLRSFASGCSMSMSLLTHVPSG